RRAAAERGRRGRALGRGVRSPRRGVSALLLRQLRGESADRARADAAGLRVARALSRRGSVAAIVADALARAPLPRVFAAAGAPRAVIDAARTRGLAVIETAGTTAACVMAAVTAELGDAPGVAVVSLRRGLAPVIDGAAHATRDRAPVIVISDAESVAPL